MSKSGYAMPEISAQSHSSVIGICHRSWGTNGCWNEPISKRVGPSEPNEDGISFKFAFKPFGGLLRFGNGLEDGVKSSRFPLRERGEKFLTEGLTGCELRSLGRLGVNALGDGVVGTFW